ncbi:hypothetical protein ATEIFO6365_0005076600 [Aspergillus terreus]|uniref:Uncharacterized protein n=1 Tax=Aspergillus terreus TaxID=33178 RepID=A0A5M3Z1Y4_ASPTE|nr:hypothetical protein ATETN484_0007060700 [Aspergillus terreus]GFF16574.1 hypothetical protein ATEIFO6365_0005076600 [Aspergillus terreus]
MPSPPSSPTVSASKMDPEVMEHANTSQPWRAEAPVPQRTYETSRRRDGLINKDQRPNASLQRMCPNSIAGTASLFHSRPRHERRLTRGTDVHQTIGDTQDIERLDSLNSGQSHRANLTAAIRDFGSHDLERNKPGGKKKKTPIYASVFNVGTKRKSGEPPDDGQHRARPPAPTRLANPGATESRRDNSSKRCPHKGGRAVSSTTRTRRPLSVSTLKAAVAPATAFAPPTALPAAPPTAPPVAPPVDTQATPAQTVPVATASSTAKPTNDIKTGILLDFDAPLELSPSKAYDEDLRGLDFQMPDPKPPKRTPRQVYTIEELKRLEPKPEATKPKSQKPVTQPPVVSTGGLPKTRAPSSVPSGSIFMPKSSKPTVSGSELAKPQPVKSGTQMPSDPKSNISIHAAPQRDASNPSAPKAPCLKPNAPAWEPPKPAASKPNTATSETCKYSPPEGRRTLSLIGDHLLPGRGGKKATGLEGSIYAS